MRFTIIIPTCHDSQRLPGKALRVMAGAPMIRHVYERVCESGAAQVAEDFDATVVMTSASHLIWNGSHIISASMPH